MSDEFSVFKYAHDVVDEMVKYHLGEILFSAVVGSGAYLWGVKKAASILNSGHIKGPVAVIQTTSYDPAFEKDSASGELRLLKNPETGNIFRDQKIRTEEVPLYLEQIFDKSISKRLLDYFNKAAELTTNDSPVVYMHLPEVLPKKHAQQINEIITNSIQNYISGLYRDTEEVLATNLAPNQLFETNKILPLLIKEEGAVGWQLRILLIKLNQEGTIDLPHRRDVRYVMPDGTYSAGKGSVETDRYELMETIQTQLKDPAFRKLVSAYEVEIPTKRVITLADPAP